MAINGLSIHDIGAGDLQLSRQLIDLGANRVHAIQPSTVLPKVVHPNLNVVDKYIQNYKGRIRNLFLSWPWFFHDGANALLSRVQRSDLIIYLGLNDGITCCGFSELFHEFLYHPVKAHIPSPENTLIILGARRIRRRRALPEEQAGMRGWSSWTIWNKKECV